MIINGFNKKRSEFYVTVSKQELENLLGKSLYYGTELDEVIGKKIVNAIDVFKQNRSAINDLNWNKTKIISCLQEMEEAMRKVSFITPELMKEQ